MNDINDLYTVLESFQKAIQMMEDRFDQMDQMYHGIDERFHSLESVLFDDIINPAKKAMDDSYRQERYDDFYGKYGEKLDAFNEPLRSIEGEDFSLSDQAFNDYDSIEGEKPDGDEYVNALIEKVEEQLNKIAASLPKNVEVEAKIEDGEATVEVEETPAEEEVVSEEAAPEEEVVEEPVEEAPVEEELDENGEPVTNKDDLDKLYKELEGSL